MLNSILIPYTFTKPTKIFIKYIPLKYIPLGDQAAGNSLKEASKGASIR